MLESKKSNWPLLLLIVLLGSATMLGFWQLLLLRFQAGDIYPPYSSLRADPLGTKVLHDALQETTGFTVSRNFVPIEKLPQSGDSAIFYAGAPIDSWRLEDVEGLESLARKGARIIVTFLPAEEVANPKHPPGGRKVGATGKSKLAKDSKDQKDTEDEDEVNIIDLQQLSKRWGFSLIRRESRHETSGSPSLTINSILPETEPSLSWHTALSFSRPAAVWRVLYRCEGAPAIMERPFGDGSIVLAADSYFLSNEAMRAERAPRLLAWLLNGRSRVVFDETHLGVQETPGIAASVGKYRLEGFLAAIAALAGLFVWHTTSSFLPRRPDAEDEAMVTGKDSTAAFASLLRRGIAPSRLIEVCVDQWEKSLGHAAREIERKAGAN